MELLQSYTKPSKYQATAAYDKERNVCIILCMYIKSKKKKNLIILVLSELNSALLEW